MCYVLLFNIASLSVLGSLHPQIERDSFTLGSDWFVFSDLAAYEKTALFTGWVKDYIPPSTPAHCMSPRRFCLSLQEKEERWNLMNDPFPLELIKGETFPSWEHSWRKLKLTLSWLPTENLPCACPLSLRYNSHTMIFIALRCTIQWFLVSLQSCVSPQFNYRAFFSPLKVTPTPN